MKRTLLILAALTGLGVAVVALSPDEGLLDDPNYPLPIDSEDYGDEWIWADTNGDGHDDYAFRLDEIGELLYEAMDFNADGSMDNFYYRRRGVLIQQELDTNYDESIDLWVYMEDGVHVRGYQRDKNYDGTIDLEKDYGE